MASLTATRFHRRSPDRGAIWVRITLLVVVSMLLLWFVGASRSRSLSGAPPGSGVAPGGR